MKEKLKEKLKEYSLMLDKDLFDIENEILFISTCWNKRRILDDIYKNLLEMKTLDCIEEYSPEYDAGRLLEESPKPYIEKKVDKKITIR